MINHKLHWPELGYDAYEESESESSFEEWMEDPFLRKLMLGLMIARDTLALAMTAALGGLVVVAVTEAGILALSDSGVVWTFAGAITAVLILDEAAPSKQHSAIKSAATVAVGEAFVVAATIYLMLKYRNNDPKNPSFPLISDRVLLPRWGISRGRDKLN